MIAKERRSRNNKEEMRSRLGKLITTFREASITHEERRLREGNERS